MVNLDSILESRDITLPTKVHLVKAIVFPVVMYGYKSWTIKKVECWRIFIGRTDTAAETPILWPPGAKTWLIGKDPDAGKDWSQEEKGMTEDEMIGWHHQFDGHEFEQTLGVGEGQESLMCCSPWGCKELYTTEWLNWTDFSVVHAQLML